MANNANYADQPQYHDDSYYDSYWLNLTLEPCLPVDFVLRTLQPDNLSQQMPIQMLFGLFYASIFTTSIICNTWIVVAVSMEKSLHTARNIFVCSHALSDLFLTIICLPISAYSMMVKNWHFGAALCRMVPFLQCYSVLLSSFSLTAVALDRYNVICKPVKIRPANVRLAFYVVFIIWTVAMFLATPLLNHQTQISGSSDEMLTPLSQNYTFHPCGDFCIERWDSHEYQIAYGSFLLLAQFIVPFIIVAVCYYYISRRICVQVRRKTSAASRAHALMLLRQRNSALAAIALSFGLCWLPHVVLNMLRDLNYLPVELRRQEHFISLSAHCLAMSTTVWMPIIYMRGNNKFRRWSLRSSPSGQSRTDAERFSATTALTAALVRRLSRDSAKIINNNNNNNNTNNNITGIVQL